MIVCSWDPIIAGFMDKFLRFKTRKWRRQFVFFRRCHRWVSGATVVVMSETASIKGPIFCQMVSTLGLGKVGGGGILKILVAKGGGGSIFIWNYFRRVQFSYTPPGRNKQSVPNIIFAFCQRWGFHCFIWPTARVIIALLRRLHRSR